MASWNDFSMIDNEDFEEEHEYNTETVVEMMFSRIKNKSEAWLQVNLWLRTVKTQLSRRIQKIPMKLF